MTSPFPLPPLQGWLGTERSLIIALKALHLGVPDEADMACQLVNIAKEPSQRLLQVFLEAVCSDASVESAMSQLQCHHHSAGDLAYGRLLQRASAGVTRAPSTEMQIIGKRHQPKLYVIMCSDLSHCCCHVNRRDCHWLLSAEGRNAWHLYCQYSCSTGLSSKGSSTSNVWLEVSDVPYMQPLTQAISHCVAVCRFGCSHASLERAQSCCFCCAVRPSLKQHQHSGCTATGQGICNSFGVVAAGCCWWPCAEQISPGNAVADTIR